MTDSPTITRQRVPEDQRLAITAEAFGAHFPLRIEPVVYSITERMAPDYHGGYWDFWLLDNGGFYMSPAENQKFAVFCSNHWEGELSGDALGVTACLYAYSHLSFSQQERFAKVCARHYHLLREYMFGHPEVAAILGATD